MHPQTSIGMFLVCYAISPLWPFGAFQLLRLSAFFLLVVLLSYLKAFTFCPVFPGFFALESFFTPLLAFLGKVGPLRTFHWSFWLCS